MPRIIHREVDRPITSDWLEDVGWDGVKNGLYYATKSGHQTLFWRLHALGTALNGIRMVRAARVIRKFALDKQLVEAEEQEAS